MKSLSPSLLAALLISACGWSPAAPSGAAPDAPRALTIAIQSLFVADSSQVSGSALS